ncbi:MAG: aminopeptidase [Kiritimatiellae bacterium]|nr:aminopeptidase [Kiritimatiellia bacterium]
MNTRRISPVARPRALPDPRVTRWAQLLADHSLRVRRGEAVAIHAEPAAWELVREFYAAVLQRGGFPVLRLALPGLRGLFLRHAASALIARPHESEIAESRTRMKRLTILSSEDPREGEGDDRRRLARFMASREDIRRRARKPGWCVTLWPTAAYARNAGMTPKAFRDFVCSAVLADRENPAEGWRRMDQLQRSLARRLARGRSIRLRGPGTDLTLGVEGRSWISCYGRTNMPDGEVFAAPVENSAEGVVTYRWPVCYAGVEVRGVRLEFRRGRVVDARAEKNERFLHEFLRIDRGARGLGEIGIGTNPRIDRITRMVLFDEKIGGTIHLALGSGGRIPSRVHWDMICDLRSGDAWLDDQPLIQHGRLCGWPEDTCD